ncbi:MAG: haloacid dehalogenase, partial [Phototrophicaceae bacterium]
MKFSDVAALVIDMDGVLWRDSEPLPGLVELFDWLAESGTPYVLATNNSTNSPVRYVAKLASMGVEGVPVERIITSGTATAAYMQRRYPAGTPVHVFGMDSLRQIIEAAGFDISDEEPAQVVV